MRGDRELEARLPGASGPGPAGRGAVLSALSKGIKEVYDTTKEPLLHMQRVGLGGR